MAKNLTLFVFSLACLACVGGIGFVLYDSVVQAGGSRVQGFGIIALFVMVLGLGGRYLWNTKRAQ